MPEGTGTETDKRTSILLRQVETKVALEGENTSAKSHVDFGKLISKATGSQKCQLIIGWILAGCTGAILPMFFFFIGPAFDAFGGNKTQEEIRDEVRELCAIMGGITIAVFFTSFGQNWMLMKASASMAANMKTEYLKNILNQDSAWFDQVNYTELSSRLSKDVDSIQRGVGTKFGQIVYSLSMCASGLFVAFYKGWTLAFAMLGIGPILLTGMIIFSSIMMKRQSVTMKAYAQSAGYAEQALSAVRIVVSFGQEELEVQNYKRFLQNVTVATLKGGIAIGCSMGFFFFCIYINYVYCFAIGSVWIDKAYWNDAEDRPYLAGDCLAVFFGVLFGMFALGGAGPAFNAVTEAKAAGKSAFDIIDRVSKIPQDVGVKHAINGKIEFKRISFYYPTRPDQSIMSNLSYTFEAGKTYAIVGPSGSGKSTTIQLLERFYDPSEGQVLVDGVDLKTINLRDYRRQIGYVGQEPVLFNQSIKQNLLLGKPNATDDEIVAALKAAEAWDFVSQYPDTFNTNVGGGGGRLSGGQKQRIALARAFIKKPRMLIFDEATSALDKRNEALVQHSIDKLKHQLGGNVTTFVIAHRLTTVKDADVILVLKKGAIVEEGNHNQLSSKDPSNKDNIYAKMYAAYKAQEEEEANKKGGNTSQPDINDSSMAPGDQTIARESLIPATQQVADKADGAKVDQDEDPVVKDRRLAEKLADNYKAHEPEAYDQLVKAEMARLAEERKITESLSHITDPKKASDTFRKELGKYVNNGLLIPSLLLIVIYTVLTTMFGWFIMECMNSMNISAFTGESIWDLVLEWLFYMIGASVIILIGKSLAMVLLSKIAEAIVQGTRKELYMRILRKDIGWHDHRENASGIMTATLSSDVQLLNGVSSDGLGVTVEAMVAILFATVFAFVWSWPMALCCLVVTPFIMICGAIVAKADQEGMMGMEEEQTEDDKSDDSKESQILATDSISNYKTVASFGNDQVLIDQFAAINDRQAASENKSSCMYGFSLGLSTAIQNGVFAILYLAYAELFYAYPDYKYTSPDKQWIAMFVFIFGAFTAANASAMGPDIGKATKAATKIFQIIQRPTKIDALSHLEQPPNMNEINKFMGNFKGKIEFRNVWFRYPARPAQWIFKGLDLTIQPNESVAIVGESGQGKSTFINLVMRFYDPEFGTVLIDDVDIRTIDVRSLRTKLGLVMQEPTLFNYSILENILYGNLNATNTQIENAAETANALEFIASKEISQAFADDASSLLQAMNNDQFKESLKKEILMSQAEDFKRQVLVAKEFGTPIEAKQGMSQEETLAEQKYEKYLETMKALEKKAEENGKFEEVADLVDSRKQRQPSLLDKSLHEGFQVFTGQRGSKLSGGQKQRVAIARAIVRNPGVLMLDEATSALDEESQKLVQSALEKAMGNCTSIVIAHRLTTVEKCSRLAVLDSGKIVQEGTFAKLQQEPGHFANLHKGMVKAGKTEAKRRASLIRPPGM